jgi:NRAMP (natural resistance-associated macrophage protein)-like metal ion transporter
MDQELINTPVSSRIGGYLMSIRSVAAPLTGPPRRSLRRLRKWRATGLARPLAFFGIFGPGLIAANAGNDAGGIATYAAVGAQYGFGLLWMIVVVTISLGVVQEMCARMGAASGQGLSDLIREHFGVRGATFAMATLLLANSLITISEFAGIAAASELIGIPKYVTVPIAAIAIWVLVTRGSYQRVEKVFLAMTFAFFAYPIAAILARPDWGSVIRQTFWPVFPSSHLSLYLLLFVGTVGTTITPYMQAYIQAAVAEKGTEMSHYAEERTEVYLSSVFSDLISAFIIIATGATIFAASHGLGVQITDARQAAMALEPFLGKNAVYIFAIGLLGASMLAAAVVPLSTSYSICESFGFERGVSHSFQEAPVFNGIVTGMLAFGALVAMIPGLPLIQLMIIVQVVNGVLLPIILIFILKLVNNPAIMGRYVNRRGENIVAYATTGVMTLLSAALVITTILPIIGIQLPQ